MNLTLESYINHINSGELKAVDVLNNYLNKSKDLNKENNAFVRFHEEYANEFIKNSDSTILKGAPIGVKDIFLTKGLVTSCCSKMLQNYISPYSSTCFLNLEKAGACMIGKTNMDEFAMGSSTENSFFGPTINPYGKNRIPGGSSGGSAAAVASDMCIASLGTDTGGSIRQPASMCGVVGFKPTYGRVSRYGIQAMASSLDQAGVFTKTVKDAAILTKYMSGKDKKDATSLDLDFSDSLDLALQKDNLKGYKIAVINQFFSEGLDQGVKKIILDKIEEIKDKGAEVEYIDFSILDYALSVYYIIMPAELSTNLSRFDGIRFGHQDETFKYDDIYSYYSSIRNEGFQDEAKRRIMIGTYVLSAGYYDAYYLRAQKVRKLIKEEYDKIFSKYDAIVGPVSPTPAWKIGEKINDPIKMYLSDIYTIPVNLAGLPAMSLPAGNIEKDGESLPVGLHIIANQLKEENIFSIASVLEK
ncbi:Asp-tRNA(Asn)/Glu-tRNA(Gln) amidotransferase subunit GatA [Candidatus Vampirococcus lugosii]|uniref:Glutamyl-tRNA(Gln) amidotransferase subunit A n=1 Tax=Candidatus Vampirococcus lugosii TaxID=2789015 RepID=A0ABS5QMI4_9BACT|nr:Asp-tRNA(Asn)/Glu-tRNA(Gln) amidotransferase subunit GatA [Candidatus Vampirococcus lugosii]MBS8121684.1 glutamyl-tRNA(Gln) amidotransferase [Candidatus Vampirococcus lugosii]